MLISINSIIDSLIYKSRLFKLTRLVYLIDKAYNLNLELDDIDGLIQCLEDQVEPDNNNNDDSESASDCGSADEEDEDSQDEPINLMINLDDNSRRVLRSQTQKKSNSNNLVIKGKGWKLD